MRTFGIDGEKYEASEWAPKGNVVEANAFVLKDASGSTRAQLSLSNKGEVGLWFFDGHGNARISVRLTSRGPGLAFFHQGHARVVVGVDNQGAGIGLGDSTGNPRITMAVFADNPVVFVSDK